MSDTAIDLIGERLFTGASMSTSDRYPGGIRDLYQHTRIPALRSHGYPVIHPILHQNRPHDQSTPLHVRSGSLLSSCHPETQSTGRGRVCAACPSSIQREDRPLVPRDLPSHIDCMRRCHPLICRMGLGSAALDAAGACPQVIGRHLRNPG